MRKCAQFINLRQALTDPLETSNVSDAGNFETVISSPFNWLRTRTSRFRSILSLGCSVVRLCSSLDTRVRPAILYTCHRRKKNGKKNRRILWKTEKWSKKKNVIMRYINHTFKNIIIKNRWRIFISAVIPRNIFSAYIDIHTHYIYMLQSLKIQ